MSAESTIHGREHWTTKGNVRLFLWEKAAGTALGPLGTILFVHERITAPTIVLRGQYDGIASMEDLLDFFAKLPNPDKQFAVMPGIAHASLQQKNYQLVYHLLHHFFSQPAPVHK